MYNNTVSLLLVSKRYTTWQCILNPSSSQTAFSSQWHQNARPHNTRI